MSDYLDALKRERPGLWEKVEQADPEVRNLIMELEAVISDLENTNSEHLKQINRLETDLGFDSVSY